MTKNRSVTRNQQAQDGSYLASCYLTRAIRCMASSGGASQLPTPQPQSITSTRIRMRVDPPPGAPLRRSHRFHNLIRIVQAGAARLRSTTSAAQSHVGGELSRARNTPPRRMPSAPCAILRRCAILGSLENTDLSGLSTSEPLWPGAGDPPEGDHPFYPVAPTAWRKLYAYWITVNYRARPTACMPANGPHPVQTTTSPPAWRKPS